MMKSHNHISTGYDTLVVLTDAPTHWVESFPTYGQTALTAATILYDQVICRYHCPQELLSDSGPQFRDKMGNEFVGMVHIKLSLIRPFGLAIIFSR